MAKLPDISGAIALDENLREVARWPERIAYAIRRARKQLGEARDGANDIQILRTLGYLTDACRIAGEHDAAVAYGQEALDRSRTSGNPNAEIANLLRLAEAHQYRNDSLSAEPLFREAIALSIAGETHALHDSALQQLGTFLIELGRYDESIAALEGALALRRARGNRAQIDATMQALELARARSVGSE